MAKKKRRKKKTRKRAKTTMNIPFWIALCIPMLIAAIISVDEALLRRDPVSRDQYRQLKRGMTEAELKGVLGYPFNKYEQDDGGVLWIYGSARRERMLKVMVDSNRVVTDFGMSVN